MKLKSKELTKLGKGKSGLKAEDLAPTGLNRQNFYLEQSGEKVVAKPENDKEMTIVDLGIVKYHFEIGAGKDRNIWSE